MNIIFCIDDQNGMMFNHRRQSRDQVLLEDVLEVSRGGRLLMNTYSAKMFAEYGLAEMREAQGMPDVQEMSGIEVREDFLSTAGPGDFCFVEDGAVQTYVDQAERIILYRWNRHYPADVHFEPAQLEGWKLEEMKEFAGSSHEKITREVYVR